MNEPFASVTSFDAHVGVCSYILITALEDGSHFLVLLSDGARHLDTNRLADIAEACCHRHGPSCLKLHPLASDILKHYLCDSCVDDAGICWYMLSFLSLHARLNPVESG